MAKASAPNLTVEILKQIRDEVRKTNTRIEETNARLDETNVRLEGMGHELGSRMDRLERRHTETEVRLSTELLAVVGAVNAVRDAIVEDRQLRRQVADHETRIDSLERRAG